ncbi:MAG TPA: pilus assembly protein PilM [Gaiellaceae bacterium]|jgi:type IV pilus assembly protein PilM|nr:pilus assembly protein PilM [Gaiellaceae bacterium]
MVDLHKEIKLSDFLPKKSGAKARPVKVKAEAKRKPLPPEIVGLKIEAGGLTAAHVVNNGGKKLLRIAQSPLDAGIVNGGEVRDPAGLATALNELFSTNSLPRNCVRLGLANTRIGVRTIEITGAEDSQQLQNAVSFRAHELLSTPLDEAVLDFQVLDTSTNDEGQPVHRVLLVIALRDSVDRQLAATDAANLEVTGIDLDAFALLRAALAPVGENPDEPSAVIAVSIDHDLTTLAISDGTTCHFTRVLEWGTANVDLALGRALKVEPAGVPEIRSGLSLEPTGEAPAHGQGASQPADIVRREMQTLARELLSSIRFYGSQPGATPVQSVVVSGALVDLPGFSRRLSSDLGLPVSSADPFGRVELAPDVIRPEQSGGLVVAVGLGIED